MSEDRPRPTRTFRAAGRARFDAARAGRQSIATRAAIDALGAVAALHFLNEQDETTTRLIDLAGASEEGLQGFRALLAAASDQPQDA